jgi:hypothetical protein
MKHKAYLLLLPLILILLMIPANQTNGIAQEVSSDGGAQIGADTNINTSKDVSENVKREFEIELASMSRAEVRTRNASVKIYTPSGGHGSGGYFLFEGHHVIFTAAHVVRDGPIHLVVDRWENARMGVVAHVDEKKDFAILLIPEFKKTKPLKLKLPTSDPLEGVGTELVFSGFPTHHSLTTIRGYTAGREGDSLIMHAAAWMGSSGSCVFDKKGNLIGVLFAISVGGFRGEPVLMEDMVWVASSSSIDWEAVKSSLKALD